MKKRLLCVFIVMACAMTAVFASGHTRNQVLSFLREYESVATDFENVAKDLERAVDNYIRYERDIPSSVTNKAQSVQTKLNDLQAKIPFYYDELNDDDYNRIYKANEKISVASAKMISAQQRLVNSIR